MKAWSADFLGLESDEDFHARGLCSFGGSQPSGSTTTVQKADPWSGQQGPLLDIYGQAQSLDRTAVPQYYPDNTYASLTPAQNGLISNIIGYGTGGGNSALQAANSNVTSALSPSYTAGTQGVFNQGQNVLSREMNPDYLNPWNSPSFQTVVGNTLASALPAATSSFAGGNRSDSGLATRAATMAATDAVGNLAQNQYNTNQQIQNQAASQAAANYLTQQGNQAKLAAVAPLIDQSQLGDLGTALSTAGMTQQDLQNQISANMARYNYDQMLPWNQLALYQNAIQGYGSPGGTTSTSQPYFTNPTANVMSTIGGLGSLAMMGATLFSDRRLKEDIHRIGTADSGFPLYTFRYKGESPASMHIGLMAQDVEKKMPGAVIETPIGKAVDYAKALTA